MMPGKIGTGGESAASSDSLKINSRTIIQVHIVLLEGELHDKIDGPFRSHHYFSYWSANSAPALRADAALGRCAWVAFKGRNMHSGGLRAL